MDPTTIGLGLLMLSGASYLVREPLGRSLFHLSNRLCGYELNLEKLLRSRMKKVKDNLATSLQVSPQDIDLVAECGVTGRNATPAKGGYIRKLVVSCCGESVGEVYHKVSPQAVGNNHRSLSFNSSHLATLVQAYFTEEHTIPFIPKVLTKDAFADNLSEGINGQTLEQLLTLGMSLEQKRENFKTMVERLYHLDSLASPALKQEIVAHRNASSISNQVYTDLIGVLEREKGCQVYHQLGFNLNEELCHGDLTGKNIVLNSERGPCFVDWADVQLGELYFEIFKLQKEMGLEHDPEINQYVDDNLSLRYPDVPEAKKRILTKGYLELAAKTQVYLRKDLTPETRDRLNEVKEFYLLSALREGNDPRLNSLLEEYAVGNGCDLGDGRYSLLKERYDNHYSLRKCSEIFYRQEFTSQELAKLEEEAITKHQEAVMEQRVNLFSNEMMSRGLVGFWGIYSAYLAGFQRDAFAELWPYVGAVLGLGVINEVQSRMRFNQVNGVVERKIKQISRS
ncbi:MAG: phosphotransferase [Candidatus Woesearchaeota archaeon]